MKISLFWMRRDLRLDDNTALYAALQSGLPVLPIFIFDEQILKPLPRFDRRVIYIHQNLVRLQGELQKLGSDLLVLKGEPGEVLKQVLRDYDVAEVYANRDYEPYAKKRDEAIEELLDQNQIAFHLFKDQVAFERDEILNGSGEPYRVFSAYYKKWREKLSDAETEIRPSHLKTKSLLKVKKTFDLPSLEEIGFEDGPVDFPVEHIGHQSLEAYDLNRNGLLEGDTTQVSLPLRFGTLSPRQCYRLGIKHSEEWLRELAWRDFFMQILYHYPEVTTQSFYPVYDQVAWNKPGKEFRLWTEGKTGYPIVDAGMRQLNETGRMPNRVRMIVGSFLTKHLLIHWKHGERYFAEKLLDYELSSNNGNWQWVAGTGVDASPYFRVFNPWEQAKKFDPDEKYVRSYIPEYGTSQYPKPIVDHKQARLRAIEAFKAAKKS